MNIVTLNKTYAEPPFCEKEILRYAGCKTADNDVSALLNSCVQEIRDKLSYNVCYCEVPISIKEDVCDFGVFSFTSKHLATNLSGCEKVLLFAATIGIQIDRLVAKYGRISPSRAVMLQAIGAERIEALCDAFCDDMAHDLQLHMRPRFSPGYGDLPLDVQKDIFAVIDCTKRLGIFLNDSMLMSPSKSVTAFIGLCKDEKKYLKSKCSVCDKQNCAFRGAL